ncbi:unnamed protein product [Polarella glacialis]|uniref:Uncharacterized protein n=1 Tax=Polarella glacialis TaxID=89957 RepID=A0A813DTJ2_POLGL|nr:unnamed protein product [Polarella glacialis]|mmetsp:Transcript_63779/g.114789  ORF Transcript_63779/g.114789 Transcript_63779/m.114789 type:complete len:158 (+) Transcript_63779:70-543(+)
MKMASRVFVSSAVPAAAWLLLLFPLQAWSQAANPAVVSQEAELKSLGLKFLALKAQPEVPTGSQPDWFDWSSEPKGFSRRLDGDEDCSGNSLLHQCKSLFHGNSKDEQQCCREHLEHVARELPWWAWPLIIIGLVCFLICLWRCCCAILCFPCRRRK